MRKPVPSTFEDTDRVLLLDETVPPLKEWHESTLLWSVALALLFLGLAAVGHSSHWRWVMYGSVCVSGLLIAACLDWFRVTGIRILNARRMVDSLTWQGDEIVLNTECQ